MGKYIFDIDKFKNSSIFDDPEECDIFIKDLIKKDILSPIINKQKYGDGELHRICIEFHKQNPLHYPIEFYESFLEYWTAPLQKGKKKGVEQWREERTFQIGSRLRTSFKITWNDKPNYNKQSADISGSSNRRQNRFIAIPDEICDRTGIYDIGFTDV